MATDLAAGAVDVLAPRRGGPGCGQRSPGPGWRLPPVWSVAAVLVLASMAVTSGRAGPAPQAVPNTFRSETDLVIVHVVVRDRDGTIVQGLPPSSFRLFDEGRPQGPDLFVSPDAPVTIGLVVDGSGSMSAERVPLTYAVSLFAGGGHESDEIFGLVVGDEVRSALPTTAPFTHDVALLRAALFDQLQPRGRTALWDGIAEGLRYVRRGAHARRALVVLSDGADNASSTTFAELMAQAARLNVPIYSVALIDRAGLDANPGALGRLARASGGAAYAPRTPREIWSALREAASDIRAAYTLGFPPEPGAHDGAFHRLRVEVSSADGRKLRSRARAGYVAGTVSSASSENRDRLEHGRPSDVVRR